MGQQEVLDFLSKHKYIRFTSREIYEAVNKERIKKKEQVLGQHSYWNNLKALVNHNLISWDTEVYEHKGNRVQKYVYWIQDTEFQFNPLPKEEKIENQSKQGFGYKLKQLFKKKK